MNLLIIATVIAFVVSFLWLRHIYYLDIHQKEDKWLLAKVFLAGCLSAIPAGFINTSFDGVGGMFLMMIMVGFVEEGVKYGAVRASACKNKDFDEPTDGILFASTAALGFAFMENIDYNFIGLINKEIAVETLMMRTVTPFLHMMLSGIWGAYLGLYKMGYITKGAFYKYLAIMALAHSGYDIGCTYLPESISYTFITIALLALAVWFYRKVEELNHLSPFKANSAVATDGVKMTRYCANCGKKHDGSDKFCKYCGVEIG